MHSRSSSGRWDGRGIDDEVAHLAEEDIDGHPVELVGVVRVAIDEPKAAEAGCRFERWRVGGIADELSEIGRTDGG